MTIVYKLVLSKLRDKNDIDSQVYTSLVAGEFEAEYNYGYITNPPHQGSCLYAFRDLDSAVAYAAGSSSLLAKEAVLRIFKCAADVVQAPAYYTVEDMEGFWTDRWWVFGDGWPYVLECPENTVWCNWIKPLELEPWTDGRTLKVPKKEKSKSYGW